MKQKAWKSDSLLLLAAAIWGFAFVAQRAGMEHVGPFIFNAVRFALGSLVLLPLLIWNHRNSCRYRRNASFEATADLEQPGTEDRRSQEVSRTKLWIVCTAIGLILFIGASFQQIGIVYTTAGKAGFITGLYVIIVPILGIFLRHRPGIPVWIGACSAVTGLYMLSMTERFTISLGDSLVLVSAFFWAFHVLSIGWLSSKMNPIMIAFVQFIICSALSFATSFLIETTTLAELTAVTIPILYTGIFSVGVAYTLQVVAQREAPPAHAAIILSLETVFAGLGGWLILSEILSVRALFGCALMLAGFIVSQIGRRSASQENLDQPDDRDRKEEIIT